MSISDLERKLLMSDKSDPLLMPFTLKGLHLRNRLMSTSHACGLEEGGFPQDAYQRYHEEKARGGIGLTMFGGSSNIAPDSPSVFQQLNVGTDEIIPHLQRFSERAAATPWRSLPHDPQLQELLD